MGLRGRGVVGFETESETSGKRKHMKPVGSDCKAIGLHRGRGLPRWRRALPMLATVALAATGAVGAKDTRPVSFNRDIRPIMSHTCFRCHGPDKNARMAELRLDIREEALKPRPSGAIPIVPGDPDKSAIIQRIFAEDPAMRMPPKFAHKELTAAQKELMRRWVAEGAKYEGHWAFEPIRRPDAPEIANPPAPIRNPIDAFVQARLAREGLPPSPEADRRTLIRRVMLDLTGIPPTLAEVDAFLRDSSPTAYERLVERLLASPHFAEKQAMHWLDAVRYADTNGFHKDFPFPAWPYRDYVLRAFRDNKPFDQFTREQLAGDLLPGATLEQKVASAYNRLNRTSSEGGIQDKEYLAKYGADRVRTTSSVWLGITIGCAECHDHKFDPILTRDFYSMKAFWADLKETGIVPTSGPKAHGVRLSLPSEEQSRRLKELDEQLAQARQELDQKAQALAARRREWERQVLKAHEAGELAWRYQRPVSARSVNGAKLTIYNDDPVESNFWAKATFLTEENKPGDGLIVTSGPNPDNETYIITLKPGEGVWTALGIDVHQDRSLPGELVARGADRIVLTEVEGELSADATRSPKKLSFILATDDGQDLERSAMAAIDGDHRTGWGVNSRLGRSLFLALRFSRKVRTGPASVLTVRLRHDSHWRRATIGRFRLALSSAEHSWPETGDANVKLRANTSSQATLNVAAERGLPAAIREVLCIPEASRTEEQQALLLAHFQWSQPELEPLVARVARLEAERGRLEVEIPEVVVAEATTPRETRILPRGNWMDDSGEIVQPAIPVFLGQLGANGRATRLDLANWLVSPQNPLTARVFVNRLWRQLFGTGLSRVLEDLGAQGEWPTHPELLDWLAAEFMQPSWNAAGAHPWDMKHLIRTIVTSHTYRQSSLSNPQLDERDPDNRLLARQSRFRVDAEVVRDIALAVSGLLVEKFGGPSVFPYQPEGYWAAMNLEREYSASHGEDLYRRGLYTHWQRTSLHPTLLTFDASSREECTVSRFNSNTPLQALVLLNDPIFVEAARVFAENILRHGGRSFNQRLEWALRRALSRPPAPAERKILADLHRKSLGRFRADPGGAQELIHVGEAALPKGVNPAELAAMTTVARAILNLHETITRN